VIFDPFFRFIESRAVVQSLGHPKAGLWLTGNSTKSGQAVTDDSSLTWSAIWAARNKIASALAQLPCKLKQRQEDGSSPDATGLPLYNALLNEPNGEMDAFVFWEMMFDSWVNFGNAYAEKIFDGSGRVVELWPMRNTNVVPSRDPNGKLYYKVMGSDGVPRPVSADNILNIVGPLPKDGMIGRGVIDYAAECIGTAIANQDFQASYYANGAVPRGVVRHPNKMPSEARQQFREEWNKIHGGGGNYGKLAILWEGMEYTSISDSAAESQLIEKMNFSIGDVARWYDLPPHVIRDLTRSTNNNIESEQRSLVIDSYGPRLARVEKSLRRQLLSREQKASQFYIKFNVDALLRGDPEKRVDVQNKRLLHAHITLNDIMRQEDMALLPPEIGDVRFFPLNHTTVDKAIEQEVPTDGDPIPGDPSGSDTPDDMQPGRPPERSDQPKTETRDAIVEACEAVVSANLRRMMGVEANAVQRLAKKPSEFLKSLDEFYAGHEERLREALTPSLHALSVAGGVIAVQPEDWCAESRKQLLDAADGPPDAFEQRVREVCEKWTTRLS
jgi:HK97 family phage portal protein